MAIPPPRRFTTNARVRKFTNKKGWGVLDAPANRAPGGIWFYWSALEMTGYKTISPGQLVEADVIESRQDNYDYVAERVRPLPDESPESLHRRRHT